jgi:hypothetical protein
MTPDHFNDCLRAIRWTPSVLADALGCKESLVRKWATGQVEVPVTVEAWIKALATMHRAVETGKPEIS